MPARKPAALQKGHDTNAEKNLRLGSEAKARTSPVSRTAPRELNGLEIARKTWRGLVSDFQRAEGMELDKLDRHVLIDLCLAEEELSDLMKMRMVAFAQWEANTDDITSSRATVNALVKRKAEDVELTDARRVALGYLKKNQELYKTILSLDARIDAKKKLKFIFYQSMYLTPRSRAGANPEVKEDESKKPVSGMAALFGSPVKVGLAATRGDK
jgi:hypothetical protein